MLDRDVVGAAPHGPGLDQLDATEVGRLKAHAQLVRTVHQRPRAGLGGHQCLVVGHGSPADQARLRHIHALRAFVEQHKVLFAVHQIRMLQQFCAHQRSALGIEAQAQHIGDHFEALARRSRCSRCARRRHRRRCRRGSGTGDRNRGIRRWRAGGCSGIGLCRHGCGPWEEGRAFAVVQLPFVPQQDHGKTEYHPQDGAADVVHGDFFGEEEVVVGGISRENSRVARGASCGTGSCPPAHQGWQRPRRQTVSQAPRAAPCRSSACSAYTEQVGSKRQAEPSQGLNSRR